jgi:hypothetical protein
MSSAQAIAALNMNEAIRFFVSWLVWPVALSTLVVLGYRCIREKRFLDALPLLATQLNSAFIFACIAAHQVGYYNHKINGSQFIKGDYYDLHNYSITAFLDHAIYFEPLNLFLYTWRFLN